MIKNLIRRIVINLPLTEKGRYRFILKQLWKNQCDKNSPAVYKTNGIPKEIFIRNLIETVIAKTQSPGIVSLRYGWVKSDLRKFLDDCEELKYIDTDTTNPDNILIGASLTGREFIKFSSKFKWVNSLWSWIISSFKHSLGLIIVLAIVLYAPIFTLATFFGFTVESYNIFGASVIKIPRFEYSYEPTINAFVIKNKNNDRIRIDDISWGISVGDMPRAMENYANNGIVEISTLKGLLCDELSSRIENKNFCFPKVDQQVKDFIECVVLPSLDGTGIPARVSIYYNFEGENETRIMRDLIYFRGINDISPNVYVERRNVSLDEAYDFVRNGGVLNSVLDGHAQELKEALSKNFSYRDKEDGHCTRTIMHGYNW